MTLLFHSRGVVSGDKTFAAQPGIVISPPLSGITNSAMFRAAKHLPLSRATQIGDAKFISG